MNRGYLVLSLILLSTIAIMSLSLTPIPSSELEVSIQKNVNHEKRTFSLTTVINEYPLGSDETVIGKNITLSEIYYAIIDYTVEYGGLKQTFNSIDSYANSTFWGLMALYLIGSLDNYKSRYPSLEKYIGYLYDEDSGGFRDWLEGEPTLVSTGLGVLLINITSLTPNGFDKNKTIEFILNGLNSSEIGLEDIVFSSIALSILNYNISTLNLENRILSFYNNGKFTDSNSHLVTLELTYWALKALKYLNYNITTLRSSIVNYILSLMKEVTFGNSTYTGFSLGDKPTVYETGLAIDILREFNYNVAEYREGLIDFLIACYDDGNFTETINSTVKDIYQIAGAVLTLFNLGDIYSYMSLSASIAVGDQVPIDLNSTEVSFKIKIGSENIGYYVVSSNVTGKMYYDSQTKEYKGIMFPSNYTFGNYTMMFNFKPTLPLVSDYYGHYLKAFRIGYKISVELSSSTVAPGNNLTISVDVTFENGTYASSGDLYCKLGASNETLMANHKSLTNNTIEFNVTIPQDAQLGDYKLELYVNDSHGVDHTRFETTIHIRDTVKLDKIVGNITRYHIGETISINATLIYNTSGAIIPHANITPIYTEGGKEIKGVGNWINATTVNLKLNVSRVPPKQTNYAFKAKIEWSTGFTTVIELFKFNITINDLLFDLTGTSTVQIGDTFSVGVRVYSNTTNAMLENATVKAELFKGNETYSTYTMTYNKTLDAYVTNKTVDPNIPSGVYDLNITLYDPINGTYIKLNTTGSATITVTGIPEIDLETFEIMPDTPKVGEVIVSNFKVKVKGTNPAKYLTGLILRANISKDDTIWTEYIGEANMTYTLSFRPDSAGTYNITIYRDSDNYVLYTFTVDVVKVSPSLYDILEPYILGALWIGALGVGLVYFVVRYFVGKKISKRYLVKKVKKTKKKKRKKK